MANYEKTFPVSWEELHRNARALSWRLVDRLPYKGVIAITRGGLVPAAMLARELEIRLIDTVCIATYDKRDIGNAKILKRPDAADDGSGGEGWLLVDDLVDTGATARIVRELVPNAHLATVYAKPAGRPMVDTFVTEVSQDTWILFPWDTAQVYADPVIEQG